MAAGGRPVGVTVVAVIAFIVGVLQIVGAIAQLVTGLQAGAPQGLFVLGLFYLVIGVATVAVGVGLFRGNPLARTIAAVVFVIGIVTDVITLFVAPGSAWVAIIGIVLRVVGIVLLYTRPANAFFSR